MVILLISSGVNALTKSGFPNKAVFSYRSGSQPGFHGTLGNTAAEPPKKIAEITIELQDQHLTTETFSHYDMPARCVDSVWSVGPCENSTDRAVHTGENQCSFVPHWDLMVSGLLRSRSPCFSSRAAGNESSVHDQRSQTMIIFRFSLLFSSILMLGIRHRTQRMPNGIVRVVLDG